MHKKIVYLLLLFITTSSQGQDYSKHRIPCEKVVYPIHYYHVLAPSFLDPPDNTYLNMQALIDETNQLFSKTCIEFKLCKYDTIRDYNYLYLTDDDNTNESADIVALYYNPFAINVYRVLDMRTESFFGLCWEKSRKPRIFLSSSDQVTITNTTKLDFMRQMCRYFGLLYTNSTISSMELVNTSNGLTTADSTWDTPADPFTIGGSGGIDTLLYPATIPPLLYYYSNRKDANGDFYNPLMYNVMSINDLGIGSRCTELTHEQYQKIVRNERICRKKFWSLE